MRKAPPKRIKDYLRYNPERGTFTWIKRATRKTEKQAARAYDLAARKHHGAFARLNFPRFGVGR